MTEYISGWVRTIAAATMIIAAASALAPKNSAGRAVMLCGSIMMTAVLVSPIKKFDVSRLAEYTVRYESEVEYRTEELDAENKKLREAIIEENLRAYILQRAESMGIICDVQINCRDDVPHTAVIQAADRLQISAVSELLEEECGIPTERQTFKIEV